MCKQLAGCRVPIQPHCPGYCKCIKHKISLGYVLALAGCQLFGPLRNNIVMDIVYFSMREHYHLSQAALNAIMHWTATICQDSVNLAGQRIQRKLANITPSVNCDIGDCLDLADYNPFQDCRSDWLRSEFINKHFHVVVSQNVKVTGIPGVCKWFNEHAFFF